MAVTLDNLISSSSAGQGFEALWNKQTGLAAYTAGRWYDTSYLWGNPTQETYPGTPLTATLYTQANNPGFLYTGGNVSPMNKYLTKIEALTTAATLPAWLLLVDMLMYYPQINQNTNVQQLLINNVSLPRYTTGNGVMMFLNTIAGTTNASTVSLHPFGFNYTNYYGTTGRVIPGTVALTASAIVPHIIHSGVAANNFGPIIPLAAADQGVRSVQNVQFNVTTVAAGTASTVTLVLCKPLALVPLTTIFVPQGRNFIFDMPSMQRIYDGACLNFLLFAGAATPASTQLMAEMSFKWW